MNKPWLIFIVLLMQVNAFASPIIKVSKTGLVSVLENEKTVTEVKFNTGNDSIEHMPNTYTSGYKRNSRAITLGQCLIATASRWHDCDGCAGIEVIDAYNPKITQSESLNVYRLDELKMDRPDSTFGLAQGSEEGII
ncbi:MAG: hypothetical protein KAG18_07695 [Sinobacterium sp.]|nr:hypothetical protein [Sinobacterium sp.]